MQQKSLNSFTIPKESLEPGKTQKIFERKTDFGKTSIIKNKKGDLLFIEQKHEKILKSEVESVQNTTEKYKFVKNRSPTWYFVTASIIITLLIIVFKTKIWQKISPITKWFHKK